MTNREKYLIKELEDAKSALCYATVILGSIHREVPAIQTSHLSYAVEVACKEINNAWDKASRVIHKVKYKLKENEK